MDKNQVQKYLQKDGIKCPFCGKTSLEGQALEFDNGEIRQEVVCSNCNERWIDVYKLADVEEVE